MDSNWRLGVVAGGQEDLYDASPLFNDHRFVRAARFIPGLDRPDPYWNSLWARWKGTTWWVFFCHADLRGYAPLGDFTLVDATNDPFPFGYPVEPDFPVTVV